MDVRKRLEKKMKKSNKVREVDQDMLDEELAKFIPSKTIEYSNGLIWILFVCLALQSPRWTDILPIKFANFLVNHRFFIPFFKDLVFRPRTSPEQSGAPHTDGDDDEHSPVTRKKTTAVRIVDIVPEMARNSNARVVSYSTTSSTTVETTDLKKSNGPWSDEEKQLLCKTIIRYPPGTPRRWEKIADVVGRDVSQVIEMAKEIQQTVGSNKNNFQTSLPNNSSAPTIDQNIITERIPTDTSTSDWSQTDQHLLECAMKTIPKDTPGVDRWEQIARCIPGKTRDECLARYRYIVQLLKAKKMA